MNRGFFCLACSISWDADQECADLSVFGRMSNSIEQKKTEQALLMNESIGGCVNE